MYMLDRKSTRLNSSHRCISYAVPLILHSFPTRRSSDLGASLSVADAGEREHSREIFLVRIARLREFLVVAQIVVAVGHTEPGLRQVDRILIGIFVVHADVHV